MYTFSKAYFVLRLDYHAAYSWDQFTPSTLSGNCMSASVNIVFVVVVSNKKKKKNRPTAGKDFDPFFPMYVFV